MSEVTKENILQTLQNNGASYFASLLPNDIIDRLFTREYTLFAPTNDFFNYLRSDIPEKTGGNKYLSIETILQNKGIQDVVPNHVFQGHLTNTKPQTMENLQMLSRLIVKYEITWDRKKKIDEIPFVGKLIGLGDRGKGRYMLHIYLIDGVLANEDQYAEVYGVGTSKLSIHEPPEYGYDISEETGEPDLTGMDKHERCIYHLKAKNSAWCASKGYPAYQVGPDGKVCYSPYSICARVH